MSVPSDLPSLVETIAIILFYFLGALSLLVNSVTLAIIIRKGSMLESEIRKLSVFLQIACLIQNAFFTLLFIPFSYPRAGAGYCVGLLCCVLPFQALSLIFLVLTMLMFAAFGMLVVAREQLLLFDGSVLKLSDKVRRVWQERGLNWYLFDGGKVEAVLHFIEIGSAIVIPAGCALVFVPFSHMLVIVLRYAIDEPHSAIIISAQNMHLNFQFIVLIIFLLCPVLISTGLGFRKTVYADTQSK
ncbi:hypothetical protein PENTCL1PPCAC_14158, partial [Pristionchus entomophagus]